MSGVCDNRIAAEPLQTTGFDPHFLEQAVNHQIGILFTMRNGARTRPRLPEA